MLENVFQNLQEVLSEADTKIKEMSNQTFKDKVLVFVFREISELTKEAPRLLGGESRQDVNVFIGKLDILERLMDLIEDN